MGGQSGLTYAQQKFELTKTIILESVILFAVPTPFWDKYITFRAKGTT